MKEKIIYRVHGLDCPEEVAILKKEIGTRPGIASLDFDIINARMTVKYDSDRITPKDIVSAVDGTGMTAIPWVARGSTESLSFWQQQGRVIMTAISGMSLCSGFIVHWFFHGFRDAFAAGHDGQHVFPALSIAMYVLAVIAGAWFVAPKALWSAKRLRPDMNLLMAVAVAGALSIGEWFEASAVAFLFAVSLLLEQWSVGRARRAIASLLNITPPLARIQDKDTGHMVEMPVEEVAVGTKVHIRPGDRIPLDGVVVRGVSSVNQSPITGESMPVMKEPGDEVFAGTINEDGALEMRVTKLSGDTALARIIHMVEEAQTRRAPAQQWVDKFALYYTPAMMIMALLVAVLPPLLNIGEWSYWLYQGLVMLVIACPCALVISTPVAIVAALTSAARNGVLIKGGMYVEMAGRILVLCMDKTGTLTRGHPEVQKILTFNGYTEKGILQIAAALESHSEHPLARAILRKAKSEELPVRDVEEFRAIKGKGAEAKISGRPYWIGSHALMEQKGQETPEIHKCAEEMEDSGHSIVAIGNDTEVCALISIADTLRDNAASSVEEIRRTGVRQVVMLTGDNEGTARAVAKATGVDEYKAELLPDEKVVYVESFARGKGCTAMVGDGINDAPAMATANLSIAMGAMGTDAAIETADIALMSDDLSKIPWLIRHSRRTLQIIKTNIIFALTIKALFMALALMGMATLWMAIAADTGASLLVIFNALRLLRGRESQKASSCACCCSHGHDSHGGHGHDGHEH